jgi:hypothetical protein
LQLRLPLLPPTRPARRPCVVCVSTRKRGCVRFPAGNLFSVFTSLVFAMIMQYRDCPPSYLSVRSPNRGNGGGRIASSRFNDLTRRAPCHHAVCKVVKRERPPNTSNKAKRRGVAYSGARKRKRGRRTPHQNSQYHQRLWEAREEKERGDEKAKIKE